MQKVNENSHAKHEFTKRYITCHRKRNVTKGIHMSTQKTQSQNEDKKFAKKLINSRR